MKMIYGILIIGSFMALGFIWGQNTNSSDIVTKKESIIASGFPKLQAHFHKYVDDGILAGTSMLVSKAGKIHKDLYGMQNREAGLPISEKTIFRLASMTKPITSVAVLMLVEGGQLQLDDPVEKYLPVFKDAGVYETATTRQPVKSPILIRHLLSHTGGVTSSYDASAAGQYCRKVMPNKKPTNLSELVAAIAELPLAFHPGEGWAYSYSTDILALVVEKIAGEPIDQFMQKRIFTPLKMEDTGFQVPTEKLDRFAVLYTPDDQGELVVADDPKNSPYTNGQYYPRGNGGLTSTITDYFRFARMLLNGGELDGVRLLKKETVKQMEQQQVPTDYMPIKVGGNALTGWGFGLGFGVLTSDSPYGSEGDLFWPGSAFTYFFINPEKEMIGLFMTQLSDMSKMHLIGEFHELASEVFMDQ